MKLECADLEILLCDYVDGTLEPDARAAADAHLAACPACAEFARDCGAAVRFLSQAPPVEPPAEMITRILYRTQTEPEEAEVRVAPPNAGWILKASLWLAGIARPVLAPRFAMGMAMTILSFSMIARLAGVPDSSIGSADLSPAQVLSSFDAKIARVWDRAQKYYENLRLVYEIQNRLSEWSAQEEQDRKAQPGTVLTPADPQSERSSQ